MNKKIKKIETMVIPKSIHITNDHANSVIVPLIS